MRPPTFPEHFWFGMTLDQQSIVIELEERGLIVYPTGSRLICPDACGPDSDWDVFFCADEDEPVWMSSHGWEEPEAWFERSGGRGGTSLYRLRVNAIVIHSALIANRWKDATDFCVELGGPKDRAGRIKVFRKLCKD